MARLNPSPIRMYRGTTEQHAQYAGPIGELTVDTDKNTVVVQNGTDGGVPLAQERRQVIAGDGLKVNGGASGTLASDITMAVDQTWLNAQIDTRVEGVGLVTAGDGIDVTASEGKAEIAVDDTVVRTSGDQTIGGFKSFSNDVLVQQDSCNIILSDSGYTIGTNPKAVRYHAALVFTDGTAVPSNTNDKNRIVQIRPGTDADGNRFLDFDLLNSTTGTATSDSYTRLALHYGADGAKYATAPSTRSTPSANEIITYDFLQTYVADNAPKTSYLPLYFTAGTTELHSFVPAGVTQVRYAAIEADGSGTSGLTIKMTRDIGATSSMNVTGSNANCSGYANHSVMFSVTGISNQTEIAVMIEFS